MNKNNNDESAMGFKAAIIIAHTLRTHLEHHTLLIIPRVFWLHGLSLGLALLDFCR